HVMLVATGEPPGGSHLFEGLDVSPRGVGREGQRLARDGDAAGAAGRRQSMLMSELRITLEKHPCHHEVAGNGRTVRLRQGQQLAARGLVQHSGDDLLGDVGRLRTIRTAGLPWTPLTWAFGPVGVAVGTTPVPAIPVATTVGAAVAPTVAVTSPT